MNIRPLLVASLALTLSAPAFAAPLPLTPQDAVIVPGGPGAFDWMTVDAKMHRILASHKGTGTLAIFDLKTNQASVVKAGTGQGVAIDAANGKLFVGDDDEHMVTVLNRKTLAQIATIKVTGPVDDVVLDPKTEMIYADHDDGTEIWVIDAKTNAIVGTVTVPGAPEYIEYDPVTDRLYQNIKINDTVQVIDPATNKVEAVWPTAPATGPHGLAVDSAAGRVYTAGKNGKLAALDIKTGKLIGTADIGNGVDQIAFDPSNKRIYCACSGVISVVQATADGVKSLGDIPAPAGAHTLTIDPKTHAVWITYSDSKNSYFQKFTAE